MDKMRALEGGFREENDGNSLGLCVWVIAMK